MKIALMLVIIMVVVLISPMGLLLTWVITSPFVTNYIARPYMNPFFGSYRLVDTYTVSGFDFRELFNYDRIVLFLLFLVVFFRKGGQRTKHSGIDYPFLIFLAAIFLSTLYSHSFIHRFRVLVDTFGLCYIAYFLGKNYLCEDQRFKKYLSAVIVLGCVLIVVSLSEQFISRDIFLYRITGPFLYWENLGLTLAIIFFIGLYKRATAAAVNKGTNIFLYLLLILLGFCIFLTQTRTIMAVVLVGLSFIYIKGKDVINRRMATKYIILAILLLLSVAVNPMLLKNTNFYQHRLTRRTDEGRIELYRTSLRMFVANPIAGIGFRDFGEDKLKYVAQEERETRWITARGTLHNSYLAVAAEIGLIGVIPLLLLMLYSYRTCLKYYQLSEDRTEKLWALTMGAMAVIYFLSAVTFDVFFEPTIDNKLFYMSLGIAVGRYNKLRCSV